MLGPLPCLIELPWSSFGPSVPLSEEYHTHFGIGNAIQILELVGEHKQKNVEFHFYDALFHFLTIFGVTFLNFRQYIFIEGPCIKSTRRKIKENSPETFRERTPIF